METNRRTFLKASGAAALLGVTGLAGCSGNGGGGASAEQWQYDPAALLDTENRFFGSMDYGTVYDNRDSLPESTRQSFESVQEDAPIQPDDIDVLTGVGGGQVSVASGDATVFGSGAATGTFETDAITSEIESQGETQEAGSYEGYTLYEQVSSGSVGMGQNASATLGVGENALVFGVVSASGSGSASITGTQAVETAIDASNGNAEMLRANSDVVSEISNQLGSTTLQVGGQVDPGLVEAALAMSGSAQTQFVDGIRGGGFGMQLNGETTTFTVVGLYEDAGAAEDTGIVTLVNQFSDQFVEQSPEIDSIDASTDGRSVVITVEGETQALLEQGTGSVPGGVTGI